MSIAQITFSFNLITLYMTFLYIFSCFMPGLAIASHEWPSSRSNLCLFPDSNLDHVLS